MRGRHGNPMYVDCLQCGKSLRKSDMKKQHKPCKSEKLHNKRVVYEDFLGESRGKKLIYCERCCQWMAPPGIHTCSEPPELPEHWGEMHIVKPHNRSVKKNKDGFWIRQWRRWLKGKGDIVP